MTEQRPPDVGGRLRALRKGRGLSMRALAERCDLSPNAISLIERGLTSPSVSTLHRLAQALGVHIAAFFEQPTEAVEWVVSRAGERSYLGDPQVLLENLGTGLSQPTLEPYLVTLQPGATSGRSIITHGGQELVYCLQGEVEYEVAGNVCLLREGDALLFEARLPHRWRNPGSVPARFLMVFGACEDHDSLRRHLGR